MKVCRFGIILFLAWGPLVSAAPSQNPAQLLQRGLRAYDELDFPAAAGLLRTAVRAGALDSLDTERQIDVLSRLGAADVFRGDPNAAGEAFRQLLVAFPRARLDELRYPPEVTTVFDAVRRSTRAVAVVASAEHALRVGEERYTIWLFSSSHHQIAVRLLDGSGSLLRSVYRGLLGDSLAVYWDGRDSTGRVVPAGPYVLEIQSLAPGGVAERFLQLPLDIAVSGGDTLAYPLPPDPARFRPERTGGGRGVEALLGGLVGGAVLAGGPAVVARGAETSSVRWVLGGSVGLLGVVGFVIQRGGRPIPENIAFNARIRAEWQDSVAAVREYNARMAQAVLAIRAGRPVRIEAGRE